MPATAGRPTAKLPSGRYRRRMKQRLNKSYGSYGQRWQVETVFSMFKQRLGSTVNGRSYWSQCRELWLLAISYNIMLLYGVIAFLQSRLRPCFRGSPLCPPLAKRESFNRNSLKTRLFQLPPAARQRRQL
jgi:hypothetical protein